MAYSTNILPKSAAYYSLSRATIRNSELTIEADGYAEISISTQMLAKLTSKMLVVVHSSGHSSRYTNNAIQVELSILASNGQSIEFLIPASQTSSGVFNAEIDIPDNIEDYVRFTYKIYSSVPVTVYNWELCSLSASTDISTVIEGVTQALPRLLYDYNTYAFAVAQRQVTVGLITCYLTQATDLQGHFTISFFATERCNVHVRIRDNSVTELYTPAVYTVEKGYSSISIPHAYLSKSNDVHSFSVTLQCTKGQLSIPVRGMLYTIDGGYLATRILDAGTDVEDIAIKQTSVDESPSEIYAIGRESNRLILKKRPYSYDKVTWEAVYDFGEGLDAAVEFYGRWVNRNNSAKYTLETTEQPVTFIVDNSGKLNAYFSADFTNPFYIDDGVSQVAACQGFNSMYDDNQDQGLVVMYLKSGNVYYRQYAFDGGYLHWLGKTELYTGGDATFISIHRLPDYRLGMCVTRAAGTKWYITDRTYVGQAVKTELIKPATNDVLQYATVIGVDKADMALNVATQNEFEYALTFDTFTMTFATPVAFKNSRVASDLYESIEVYVDNVLYDKVFTVSLTDKVLSVTLSEGVRGGHTVRIELNCPYFAVIIYNGCWMKAYQSYSWDLPLPITTIDTKTEVIDASVTATKSIQVRGPETTTFNPIEDIPVAADVNMTIEVNKLVLSNKVYNEPVNIGASTTMTTETLLVGVSPV